MKKQFILKGFSEEERKALSKILEGTQFDSTTIVKKDLLDDIFKNSGSFFYFILTDYDGKITNYSSNVESHKKIAVNKKIPTIYPELYKDNFNEIINSRPNEFELRRFEMVLEGHYYEVTASVVFENIVFFFYDITEQKSSEMTLKTELDDIVYKYKELKDKLERYKVRARSALKERDITQFELDEQENLFKLLVDNMNDMIVKVDANNKFIFASPSYYKTFGLNEKDLIGKSFMPLVHEDDREPTMEAMKNLFDPPYTAYIEQRALTKDGWRWLAWSDKAVVDVNGNIDYIIGVGRDITEKKESEIALKENEQRLHKALLASSDAIFDINLETGEVYYSENWFRILGYNPDEYRNDNSTWEKLLHPDDKEKAIKIYEDHIKGKSDFYHSVFRLIAKDGSYKWIMSRGKVVSRDKDGNATRLLGTHTDITESKIIEDKLTEQSYFNKRIVETVPLVIGIYDLNPVKSIWQNNEVEKVTGYTKEEWLSFSENDHLNITHPDDREALLNTKEGIRNLKQGEVLIIELRIKHKEGHYIWVLFRFGVFKRGKDGKVCQFMEVFKDITELKKNSEEKIEAERKSSEAYRKLEKTLNLATIGGLTAGIAHEINQPLNALKVTVDSILYFHKLNRDMSPEKILEKVKFVSEQAERINQIIIHTRSLIKPSRRSTSQPTDMNSAVLTSVNLIKTRLKKHNIEIKLELSDSLPEVKGNLTQLEQVLLNLLNNAVRSLDSVSIDDKMIKIRTCYDDTKCYLEVSDNGPGIDSEILEQIFEPFFTTYKEESFGLGLFIVDNIIKHLGGRISVESKIDEGSKFLIYFPVYK